MNQQEKDRTLYRDKKLDKLVRFFRGKRVELPVEEKNIKNKVLINPPYDEDPSSFMGSVIQGN